MEMAEGLNWEPRSNTFWNRSDAGEAKALQVVLLGQVSMWVRGQEAPSQKYRLNSAAQRSAVRQVNGSRERKSRGS